MNVEKNLRTNRQNKTKQNPKLQKIKDETITYKIDDDEHDANYSRLDRLWWSISLFNGIKYCSLTNFLSLSCFFFRSFAHGQISSHHNQCVNIFSRKTKQNFRYDKMNGQKSDGNGERVRYKY